MNKYVRVSAIATAISVLPLSAYAQSEVVVWVAGEPGQTNVYDDLAAAYSAQDSDVTVTVVKNSSDLFNPALIPALSAGEGPDLFSFGTGPGQPAALIAGGLVADLSDAYFANDWGSTIPEGIVVQTSSDGKLWAFGNEVETTGMFYNKAIFAENGIEVPTTWAEMEAA